MSKSRPWTSDEEKKLRSLASRKLPAEIARLLNRTEAAVLHRSQKLGLTLKQQPSPIAKPAINQPPRWPLLGKLLVALSAIAGVIGMIAAIPVFLPRVSVDSVDTEESPSISYYFTAANNNFVPLEDVNLSIGLCRIQVVFKDFKGRDQPLNMVTNGQGDRCDYSNIAFLTANTWLKHRLSVDERYTFNLSEYFDTFTTPMKLSSGDIAIVLSYRPWSWPFTLQKKYFRFVTERQPSGRIRWIAKPLDLAY